MKRDVCNMLMQVFCCGR